MEVQVHGFKELQANLGIAVAQFNSIKKAALTQSAKKVQTRAINKAAVATGRMKGNISINTKAFSAEVTSNAPYSIFVETGTRPHFPPIAPLERWGLIKFGKRGLGFVLARKIAMKGTKAQPFMKPALSDSLNDISKIFEIARDTLVKLMAK